jgi:hypothetical protein
MVAAALVAGAQAMMARRLQWILVAALGCVGLGAASNDDARIVGRTLLLASTSSGGLRCRALRLRGRWPRRRRSRCSSEPGRVAKSLEAKMAGDVWGLRRRRRRRRNGR